MFRATTNSVQTSVIVRDKDGRFVPDLLEDDFASTKTASFRPSRCSRPGLAAGRWATSPRGGTMTVGPKIEGLILPQSRPKNDSSGRFFVIFIDDLHLQPAETPKVKDVLKKVRDILVHDNDLVGFVSTGTSAIEIDPSVRLRSSPLQRGHRQGDGIGADHRRLHRGALIEGAEGPQQVRFNAHVAFRTAFDLIDQLSPVTDRRKAFIYVSSGYDFNPLSESRLKKIEDYYGSPTTTA